MHVKFNFENQNVVFEIILNIVPPLFHHNMAGIISCSTKFLLFCACFFCFFVLYVLFNVNFCVPVFTSFNDFPLVSVVSLVLLLNRSLWSGEKCNIHKGCAVEMLTGYTPYIDWINPIKWFIVLSCIVHGVKTYI